MDTLLLVKILMLFVNPIETSLGTLIPYCLGKSSRAERLMSLAAAASAGIFLAIGLCHTTDDANHFLIPVIDNSHGFPVALFLVTIGFTLLLFLEKIVFHGHAHHHHHPHQHKEHTSLNHDKAEEGDHHYNSLNHDKEEEGDHHHQHHHEYTLNGEKDEKKEVPHKDVYIKALITTLSVMVHSAVSGLAVGVAQDMKTLIMLVIACLAHDWSHSTALVVMYKVNGLGWRAIFGFLALFVFTEPACIGIGMAIVSAMDSSNAHITSGVLSALAGGVFLYISVVELIHEAFEEPSDRVLKFFLYFFFLCAISAVSAIG